MMSVAKTRWSILRRALLKSARTTYDSTISDNKQVSVRRHAGFSLFCVETMPSLVPDSVSDSGPQEHTDVDKDSQDHTLLSYSANTELEMDIPTLRFRYVPSNFFFVSCHQVLPSLLLVT
jgi:hypothetical protein